MKVIYLVSLIKIGLGDETTVSIPMTTLSTTFAPATTAEPTTSQSTTEPATISWEITKTEPEPTTDPVTLSSTGPETSKIPRESFSIYHPTHIHKLLKIYFFKYIKYITYYILYKKLYLFWHL